MKIRNLTKTASDDKKKTLQHHKIIDLNQRIVSQYFQTKLHSRFDKIINLKLMVSPHEMDSYCTRPKFQILHPKTI